MGVVSSSLHSEPMFVSSEAPEIHIPLEYITPYEIEILPNYNTALPFRFICHDQTMRTFALKRVLGIGPKGKVILVEDTKANELFELYVDEDVTDQIVDRKAITLNAIRELEPKFPFASAFEMYHYKLSPPHTLFIVMVFCILFSLTNRNIIDMAT